MNEKKLKKITEKFDEISKKVDSIMHNRLIIAIFMVVDGINFVINPERSLEFMARIIAVLVLSASIAAVVTNIKSKTRDKESLIIAIALILVSIYTLILPQLFANNIRVLMSVFIILNGLINVFNVTKFNNIAQWMVYTKDRIKNRLENDEIDENFDKSKILEQAGKVTKPVSRFIEKTKNKSILYFILNIISIISGIVLLANNTETLVLCGIILIYTGVCDFFMFAKSIDLSKQLKLIK